MKTSGKLGAIGVILATVCALFVFGCDGGGGGDKPANAAGTWNGTFLFAKGTAYEDSGPTTLVLAQNGKNVSGFWDGSNVSGFVEGSKLTLNIAPFNDSGVVFTGSVSGKISGNSLKMNGVITGVSGGVPVDFSMSLDVTRVTSGASGVIAAKGSSLSKVLQNAMNSQQK